MNDNAIEYLEEACSALVEAASYSGDGAVIKHRDELLEFTRAVTLQHKNDQIRQYFNDLQTIYERLGIRDGEKRVEQALAAINALANERANIPVCAHELCNEYPETGSQSRYWCADCGSLAYGVSGLATSIKKDKLKWNAPLGEHKPR